MSGFSVLPDPNKFRLEPGEPVVAPPTLGYGLLYNWYAATDARNIAAAGWHVPTFAEWFTLQSYLGGEAVAGGKIKETGTTYWTTPNTGATNETGFNARGAGYRAGTTGMFAAMGRYVFFWSSTQFDASLGYRAGALYYDSALLPVNSATLKADGEPIRLLKDSTTLTDGQTGIYTGNDGKVYRTICIGTQEWLADNLAETKYRNGDDILEVTDNAAWVALTSGALCAYDNDWNNV